MQQHTKEILKDTKIKCKYIKIPLTPLAQDQTGAKLSNIQNYQI
jgi:hypothetical protein